MLSPMEEKEFYKVMKRVGRNLRKVRTERNKTQERISEEIGIGIKYYQQLENGDRALSMRSLFRLSKRLNVTFESLIL